MADNKTLLDDEISVIESMYGTEAFQPHKKLPSTYVLIIKLWITFPEGYPSSVVPDFKFHELLTPQNPISLVQKLNEGVARDFNQMFSPGEVVLFSWFMFLEEYLTQYAPSLEDLHIPKQSSLQQPREESCIEQIKDDPDIFNSRMVYCGPQIISGTPIEDRKSVFIAHCAEVHSVEDVKKVIDYLLEDRKIAKATHNISAYRILNSDNTINQDNDDDGETAAGSRLQHLLQVLDVKNVLVVVSRWFGGIQLGPDRFKHINNAARSILEEQGFLKQTSSEVKPNRKSK
ncbi:hypothetical protein DSO57_1035648 [Entomophthora muscae]|uniref:Uncharacterized protein n=2 Tax=Entomophthora muscae TaxID=34485 RepID=A0ACC2TYH3_9FUNG|nr:hypothetical protein DSO57_1035648 [Entomophthora muscae]